MLIVILLAVFLISFSFSAIVFVKTNSEWGTAAFASVAIISLFLMFIYFVVVANNFVKSPYLIQELNNQRYVAIKENDEQKIREYNNRVILGRYKMDVPFFGELESNVYYEVELIE